MGGSNEKLFYSKDNAYEIDYKEGNVADIDYLITETGKDRENALLKGTKGRCLSINSTPDSVKYNTRIKFTEFTNVIIIYIGQGEDIWLKILFTDRIGKIIERSPLLSRKETAVISNKESIKLYVRSPYFLGIQFTFLLSKFEQKRSNPRVTYIADLVNIQSVVTINYSYTTKYDLPPPSLLSYSNGESCPRIAIFYSTDAIYGQNMGFAFFKSGERKYVRRPAFTSVLVGEECTMMQKLTTLAEQDVEWESVITYGLLRYFLWFLITNKWNINILLQCNTEKFFQYLSKSEYACWIQVFTTQLKGYEKYFKECKQLQVA